MFCCCSLLPWSTQQSYVPFPVYCGTSLSGFAPESKLLYASARFLLTFWQQGSRVCSQPLVAAGRRICQKSRSSTQTRFCYNIQRSQLKQRSVEIRCEIAKHLVKPENKYPICIIVLEIDICRISCFYFDVDSVL